MASDAEGRIGNDDLENGILMLQHALWSEYRSVDIDEDRNLCLRCTRCKASWIGDSLPHPERHESWCPLSWTPKFNATRSDRAALEAQIERLQHLLWGAASDSHALMGHSNIGASFVACNLEPCKAYNAVLTSVEQEDTRE